MLLTLELLKKDELDKILRLFDELQFIDGTSTASMGAKAVKNNLQAKAEDPGTDRIYHIIQEVIMDSPLVQQACLPFKIRKPLVSVYRQGMTYGWHTDSPLMDSPDVRTDLAMTVFLSDPSDYDGGELVLASPNGHIPVKLPLGHAVIYPTTLVHCVNRIDKGERRAVVTWLQSKIRSPHNRELIFSISQVLASLNQKDPNSPEATTLMQVYSNMVRMWAEV